MSLARIQVCGGQRTRLSVQPSKQEQLKRERRGEGVRDG